MLYTSGYIRCATIFVTRVAMTELWIYVTYDFAKSQ